MANPYQQQVFQRKLIYIGLIIALIGVSWGFRRYYVEAKARNLGLLEETRGDVELLGAAARTGLSGLRGIATCALWMQAMEQQKKNQYSALERTVRQLMRLQPHLNTPWIFQSWNLAYNVARECDRVSDKYFYITRGIQLLAEGERQNRFQPELRREIGHYYQHKIGQSDENNTFRSLFQLSCIPPADRDPEQLRPRVHFRLTADELSSLKGGVPESVAKKLRPLADRDFIESAGFKEALKETLSAAELSAHQPALLKLAEKTDYEKLYKFCREHPQLARRLHSPPLPYDIRREQRKFRCNSAAEFVQFLADNFTVPSLYVEKLDNEQKFKAGAVRENPLQRFPVLPPARGVKHTPEDPTQEDFATQAIPDECDPFLLARTWYGYAQECIPPPHETWPADNAAVRDSSRERVPGNMQTIIFRSAPARAQTYIAERLQEEGWYDDEPFTLKAWFQRSLNDVDHPIDIGVRRQWSSEAWRKANQMWYNFGVANHIQISEQEKRSKQRLAEQFQKESNRNQAQQGQPYDPANMDEQQKEMHDAFRFMFGYNEGRRLANYAFFEMRTRIEEKAETVKARKLMYQADQLRIVYQDLTQALDKLDNPACLQAWREILEQYPDFRKDEFIQEQTFEVELKYIRLFRRLNENTLAPDMALLAALGQSVAGAPASADWTLLGLFSRPQLQPEFEVVGPFDRDAKGQPFVTEDIKNEILIRRGLKKPQPSSGPPPGMRPPAGMSPPGK
jgi:hypothetical protein